MNQYIYLFAFLFFSIQQTFAADESDSSILIAESIFSPSQMNDLVGEGTKDLNFIRNEISDRIRVYDRKKFKKLKKLIIEGYIKSNTPSMKRLFILKGIPFISAREKLSEFYKTGSDWLDYGSLKLLGNIYHRNVHIVRLDGSVTFLRDVNSVFDRSIFFLCDGMHYYMLSRKSDGRKDFEFKEVAKYVRNSKDVRSLLTPNIKLVYKEKLGEPQKSFGQNPQRVESDGSVNSINLTTEMENDLDVEPINSFEHTRPSIEHPVGSPLASIPETPESIHDTPIMTAENPKSAHEISHLEQHHHTTHDHSTVGKTSWLNRAHVKSGVVLSSIALAILAAFSLNREKE